MRDGLILANRSQIFMRKGIYNTFDKHGNMYCDERWQVATLPDGSTQLDNETTRIKPFAEPRSDSVTFLLDPHLQPLSWTIHGLKGHREGRVSWVDDKAFTCWQHGLSTNRREFAWKAQDELDYFSPLFNMLTIRRSALAAGQHRTFDTLFLDPVTFEPSWMQQTYANLGLESHQSRLGIIDLHHYSMIFGNDASSHMWCDDTGLVFDLVDSSGGGFKLVAVNFP